MKMYFIWSATKYIKMEVPQKIQIYTFSVTLGYNWISLITFWKALALECIKQSFAKPEAALQTHLSFIH